MVLNIQSSVKERIACKFVKHTFTSVTAAPQYKRTIFKRTSVGRIFFTEKCKTEKLFDQSSKKNTSMRALYIQASCLGLKPYRKKTQLHVFYFIFV